MNFVPANPLRSGLGLDRTTDACAVVVFGASGDLTKRKLVPALYNLAVGRALPGGFAAVGVARRTKTHDEFRAEMRDAVSRFSRSDAAPAGARSGAWRKRWNLAKSSSKMD